MSGFRISNHRDPDFKSPGFIESDDTTLQGNYCLYYALSSLLSINKTSEQYVGLEPPQDRVF